MDSGAVNISIANRIATINFEHPSSNALPSELLKALVFAFEDLNDNKEVCVVLLKSKGNRVFCAGASFDELIAIEHLEEGKQFFMGFANVINAMRNCSKLIIGVVEGKSVGGGVGLIAACDYAFATENASVKLSELTIGIGPFVIEPAVTRKIGLPAFTEMTLNATKWFDANWAKNKNLFTEIVSDDNLDEIVLAFSERLSSYNLEAIAALKTILWQGVSDWGELLAQRAAISGKLVLSSATKKALSKFKKD